MKFSKANAKIEALKQVKELSPYFEGRRQVYSFDLLSGYSCPFAKDCLSKAVQNESGRRIKDGPHTKFRCFSASQEVTYTNVYNLRKGNFDAVRKLKSREAMADGIQADMPKNLGICRIHVAGDFFNLAYFQAWCDVAANNPHRLFYAYTKSLNFWVESLDIIPDNFVLTASRGGRLDKIIDDCGLRESVVVFSEQQAAERGLSIDHDDSHACRPSLRSESFALLIHGIQPKGTEAAKALQQLKKAKVKHSYSRKG